MTKIEVKLVHFNKNKEKVYNGIFDTQNEIFVSENFKVKMHKLYTRFVYQGWVVFMNNNEKCPQEWLFLFKVPEKVINDLNLEIK